MKTIHLWATAIFSVCLVILLQGCKGNCNCSGHGECYERYCRCHPGFLGEHCELFAGGEIGYQFDVVAIGPNGDTKSYVCTLIGDQKDLSLLHIENLHGIDTVVGKFLPYYAETPLLSFEIASQPWGTVGSVSGSASSVKPRGEILMTYTIVDSIETKIWNATLTPQ